MKNRENSMTPDEIQAALQTRLRASLRAWDLDALLEEVRQSLGDRATEWEADLRSAIERGDSVAAAVLGLKLGAIGIQAGVNRYRDKWLKPVDVARGIGVDRGSVTRLIDKGTLRTNGVRGHGCRIDPQSLLQHCREEGISWNQT